MQKFIAHWVWYSRTCSPNESLWWKLRFIARTCVSFRYCRNWFSYLHNEEFLLHKQLIPYLCQQAMRPFYSRKISRASRASTLITTHTLLTKFLSLENYHSLLSSKKLLLGSITGKEHQYQVSLNIDPFYSREGVLSLHFEHAGKEIQVLVFSFDYEDKFLICQIGGIQSQFKNENIDELRSLAADLYSAHPRLVLIHAIRLLCLRLGIKSIEAVSLKDHVWKSWVYSRKKKVISTNYDQLWTEYGGTLKSNNNYALPLHPHFRPIESYRQKKRNIILKKRQMLNDFKFELAML